MLPAGWSQRPIVTLTTDFGEQDGFVGAMKGVILSLAPQARIVDIAHDLEPHRIAHGAIVLATAAPFFPKGTIHVVVVDPGVGTERRPLAVRTRRFLYVAPDNGVLTYVLADDEPLEAVLLESPRYFPARISATFHGRDLFAPAAAHLARGVPLSKLGPRIPTASLVRLPLPEAREREGSIEGEIIYFDRFGNAMTNLSETTLQKVWGEDWREKLEVVLASGRILPIARTYGDVEEGQPLALINSWGRLEIAVRNGRAVERLGLRSGEKVRLQARGEEA